MRLGRLRKAHPSKFLPQIIIVMVIGVVGTYLLVGSHAATPTASIETENGTVSSTATQLNDVTASGSAAVKFGGGSSGGGGSATCPAYPAFPDASCTGYAHTNTTLLKVPSQATSGTGWMWDGTNVRPTSAGVTISGLDINGGFDDGKGNITLTNSYVRCTGLDTNSACAVFAGGARVTDVEFGGCASGTGYCGAGIYTGGSVVTNNVFTRIHVHGTADGMRTDGGTTLQDSYIHLINFGNDPNGNPLHGDGSQTTQGYGMIFRHNTIEGGSNDCLFFKTDSGPIGTITITQNHLIGVQQSASNVTSFGIGLTSDVTNVTATYNTFNGVGGTATIYSGSGGLSFNTSTWNNNKLDNGTVVPAP